MKELLTLHCGIENCNIHYPYDHREDEVIAIAAEWRADDSKGGDWNGLLPTAPVPGNRYELTINFPLSLDLSQNFRAIYFEPATQYEGLESEAGIASMLFCLCKKINVLEITRKSARIEVEVINTMNVTSDNNILTGSNKRAADIDKGIQRGYAHIENAGKFSLIKADFQGDLGWMYIIENKNGKSRIVAENQWDAHRDTWQMLNEEYETAGHDT